ncbi:hypothetical protein GCM10027294_39850 [Marinactinospora endophytica]
MSENAAGRCGRRPNEPEEPPVSEATEWEKLSDDELLDRVLDEIDRDPSPQWLGRVFAAIRAAGPATPHRGGAQETS